MRYANYDVKLLQMCILTSIFSQIESISSLMRPIMYIAWIVTAVFFIARNRGRIVIHKCTKIFFGCYSLLVVGCILMALFGSRHLEGNYIHIMYIPLIVSVIGENFAPFAQDSDYEKILKTYLYGAMVYALWVNITYFSSYNDWLKQNMYTFLQKNSAAQIWATGILIALFLLEYRTKWQKVLGYACAGYLLLLCGISQCRTAVLALAVVLVCYILLKSKHKVRWSFFTLIIVLFLWNNSVTRRFIDQALLLTKYAGADINTFSSGRLDGWDRALAAFAKSPFFGCGRYYVDCSYISVLAEIGILGFVLVESVWITRAVSNFKAGSGLNSDAFLMCLTMFYFIESVLEGYPPFGPGVSSFMFWFFSVTFVDNKTEKIPQDVGEISNE